MVTLAGGTDTLDEVVITIQDESGVDHWGRGLPPEVTAGAGGSVRLGPLGFDLNASAQVVSNRQTRPGSWMTATAPDKWRVPGFQAVDHYRLQVRMISQFTVRG
jgi:hypothetical protein